jgi:hypothetical protein
MAGINYTTIDAYLTAAGQATTWADFATQMGLALRAFETQAKAAWVVASNAGAVVGTCPPMGGALVNGRETAGYIL